MYKPIVYLAGPYRDDRGYFHVLENIHTATSISADLWKMGYVVISPHRNTGLLEGAVPEEQLIEGLLSLVDVSHIVVVFGDWKRSHGTMNEIRRAINLRIPVLIWEENKTLLHALAITNNDRVERAMPVPHIEVFKRRFPISEKILEALAFLGFSVNPDSESQFFDKYTSPMSMWGGVVIDFPLSDNDDAKWIKEVQENLNNYKRLKMHTRLS